MAYLIKFTAQTVILLSYSRASLVAQIVKKKKKKKKKEKKKKKKKSLPVVQETKV